MRRKHFLYLAMGALVAFSCTNDEIGNTEQDTPPTTPEFSAPAGFTYETSRNVKLDVQSPKSSTVSIYADENKEHLLVDKLNVPTSTPLEVNIPIACNTLYVVYPTTSNPKATTPITFTSLARREVIDFTLPEDIVAPTNEEDAGWTFYHNTGVAMFEDNWPNMPATGIDADYNDVVVEYDLKVTECNDENLLPSQGYKEGLLLTLDIRAIGGKFPTTIGVVLGGLNPKYIKDVTSQIILKKGQGEKENLGDPGSDTKPAKVVNHEYNKRTYTGEINVDIKNGAPVITLDGLGRIRNDETFFQTSRDHITEGIPTIRAEIILSGIPENVNREDVLKAYKAQITDTYNQNFFIIARNNNKDREIHLKGYRPTYAYTSYESDAAGFTMEGSSYCSPSGYVWALKVPVGTKHAYEHTPFTEAYPKFENWKNTSGREDQDWYIQYDPENVVKNW